MAHRRCLVPNVASIYASDGIAGPPCQRHRHDIADPTLVILFRVDPVSPCPQASPESTSVEPGGVLERPGHHQDPIIEPDDQH
jgi:hypothetical protein